MPHSHRLPKVALLLSVLAACMAPAGAIALDFRHHRSGLEGLLDIELAYGARWRTQDADERLVSIAHGGALPTTGNYDDGTLNFNEGELVSSLFRATGELTLRWRNFGAFVRAQAFYDYEIEENDRERTPLEGTAEKQVASDAEVLDAYLSARFKLRDTPVLIRLGDQVVDWGESRFFAASGVNVANPLNLPRFQQVTSTLRDARRPVGTLWGSAHLSRHFVFEAYYQYDWQPTVLPAQGTYFAVDDGVSPGGEFIQASGVASQFGTDLSALFGIPAETLEAVGIPAFDPDFFKLNQRLRNRKADNQGQYGLTLTAIIPELNDTKIALHAANYHSKVPVLAGVTPTLPAYLGYSTQAIARLTGQLVAEGVDAASAGSAAAQTQLSRYQLGIRYLVEYPEDIQMLGLSFNTTSRRTGTAYYGEIAWHIDAPLVIHVGDVVDQVLPGAGRDNPLPPVDLSTISPEELAEQFADKPVDVSLQRDKVFAAVGATQLFGPRFGAMQSAVNLEIGWMHIRNMPSKGDLLLAAPGLSVAEFGPGNAFASTNAWGYRAAGQLVYNNVLGAFTLRPRVIWSQDVDGVSPIGAGPFREKRKRLTLGLRAEYINRIALDVSYTRFTGAGRYNLVNDRDYVDVSLRYAF